MPLYITVLAYIFIFAFGTVTGSFLNVVIYRVPKGEDIVVTPSHCQKCGYRLRWYDLIPLWSYVFLGGKCRKCGEIISPQYPVVEAVNGLFYVITFLIKGASVESLLYCLLFSALLSLSVIDARTREIPFGINVFIFVLGLVHLGLNYRDFLNYIIGAACVSGFLLILFYASKGRAIGGGDIKLMCAAGLMLGWKEIILSFALACVIGSVVHITRLKVSKADHVLAMGPYLSVGIYITVLFGSPLIEWYLGLLGL